MKEAASLAARQGRWRALREKTFFLLNYGALAAKMCALFVITTRVVFKHCDLNGDTA